MWTQIVISTHFDRASGTADDSNLLMLSHFLLRREMEKTNNSDDSIYNYQMFIKNSNNDFKNKIKSKTNSLLYNPDALM